MRACLLFLLAVLPAWAFAQATIEREATLDPRKNQRIERIRIEDASNRIEELRVGGQTQNITVQPKAGAPAYQIQPDDLAHSRPADPREGLAGRKPRVWNVLDF
jgi:hypothetical protein